MSFISAKVQGATAAIASFEKMKGAVQNRVCRNSMRPALRPQVQAAKRSGLFKDQTKALRKSFGSVVRTYRSSGVTVGVVGPRSNYERTSGPQRNLTMAIGRRTVSRPARYAHLVEHGHRIAIGPTGRSQLNHVLPNLRTGRVGPHKKLAHSGGFVAGKHFAKAAFNSAKGESLNRFSSKFNVEVLSEAAKAANKV